MDSPLLEESDKECRICLEVIPVMKKCQCSFLVCEACWSEMWERRMSTCPLCRRDLVYSVALPVHDIESEAPKRWKAFRQTALINMILTTMYAGITFDESTLLLFCVTCSSSGLLFDIPSFILQLFTAPTALILLLVTFTDGMFPGLSPETLIMMWFVAAQCLVLFRGSMMVPGERYFRLLCR